MCTVIIEVPRDPAAPTRLLAVRDEDPARAWDPPGPWWPDAHPGVVGVRDRRAGGAWLAADAAQGRLAVILNRAERVDAPPAALSSRGGIVLDAVAGRDPADDPITESFNLLSVQGGTASVVTWNGRELTRQALAPGVHMLAHHEVDDPATPRVKRWLPEFRALAGLPDDAWRESWAALLARSAELDPEDDRAIVRDNRVHGYPTVSLLVCLSEVSAQGVVVDHAALPEPGRWFPGARSELLRGH